MTIRLEIKKLQYDINREAAKILGRASKKQTKTIKDQGEKQIKAIEDKKSQLDNKQRDNKQRGNYKLLLCKEREIFKNIYNKRLNKNKITKKENGENVHYLEIIEVVLLHCNVVNNSYQQNSRVLYTFVPNKSFGQLLDISPKDFIFLKAFESEFSYIEVLFTDQYSELLEIEHKISIVLVIN